MSKCLLEKLKGELNFSIKIKRLTTTIENKYEIFSLTLYVYLCELVDEKPILFEHIASVWCDIDELENLDFAEVDYKPF